MTNKTILSLILLLTTFVKADDSQLATHKYVTVSISNHNVSANSHPDIRSLITSPISTNGLASISYVNSAVSTKASTNNVPFWDLAYSWGDHSQFGYAYQTWIDTWISTNSYLKTEYDVKRLYSEYSNDKWVTISNNTLYIWERIVNPREWYGQFDVLNEAENFELPLGDMFSITAGSITIQTNTVVAGLSEFYVYYFQNQNIPNDPTYTIYVTLNGEAFSGSWYVLDGNPTGSIIELIPDSEEYFGARLISLPLTYTTNLVSTIAITSDLVSKLDKQEFYSTNNNVYLELSKKASTNNVHHWDLAYSWGNHALAGYLLQSYFTNWVSTNNLASTNFVNSGLDSKVPYIGAISNVDLGSHTIKADTFIPNTNYVETGTESLGTVFWDAPSKTLVVAYPNGQRLNLGEEDIIPVQNDTGYTITNGMVVMLQGMIGNSGNVRVVPAYVTTTTEVHYVLGMATTDIPNGSVGKVTQRGKVRGIKTNGSQVGETWIDAQEIYVTTNPAYAGYCTGIKPPAPYPAVRIAKILSSHSSVGTYSVDIEYPYRLTDLIDVDGTPITTTGQLPVWDQVRGVFDFNYNYIAGTNLLWSGLLAKPSFTSVTNIFNPTFIYNTTNQVFLWNQKYVNTNIHAILNLSSLTNIPSDLTRDSSVLIYSAYTPYGIGFGDTSKWIFVNSILPTLTTNKCHDLIINWCPISGKAAIGVLTKGN